MARLDRLLAVKAMAQLGATLGREFSYELLQAVSPWDGETVQRGLHQLVEAEFLYQRGLPPQATYRFKHALIQEAAYQSLLRSTRQQYHRRIAEVLAAEFPEVGETQPELLAHHYTEAGCTEQAIAHWQRAGQRASERSAHVEAIAHLTTGLALLRTLPDAPARVRQELTLQLALGAPLQATKGYAAPERRRAYTRAWELCQQVEGTSLRFPVLFGLWQCEAMGAAWQKARAVGIQLLSLARQPHDPALLLEAHRALGFTLLSLGEWVAARAHAEQGIALYDPLQHHTHAFLYGQDPGMSCRIYAAFALWCLGYPDQALARNDEALRLAQERSHLYSTAMALGWMAMVHQYRREVRATYEWAEATITLCAEQGFAYYGAVGTILQGWAVAEQGAEDAGMTQIIQGLAAYRAAGAAAWRPYHLALLAEAQGKTGRANESLRVLAVARTLVDNTGERFWEGELSRLQGELLLQRAVPDARQAERRFHQALAIARRQQAKSLELRAAMSLSRL